MNDPNELEALRKENAELREQLTRAQTAAEMYKMTVHEWAKDRPECGPLTEEEIQELKNWVPGRPPLEVIAEFEEKYLRGVE